MNELRQRALRWLSRREYTRHELREKLVPHGDENAVETLLDDLERAGWLSDERAARAFVRSRQDRYGHAYLARALSRKGVGENLIERALAEEADDEWARAKAIWHKKFGSRPRDPREWARQARFLAGRGFSAELIRRLLNADFAEDAE